jgi:TPR repeat protein
LAGAQFNLGLMYFHGRGLPLDYVQAAAWYQLAAEQGHTDAQINLASMYSNGEGVAQYDAEAARLCTLAADSGNVGAQFNIGLMYANGKGVVKDQVKAHMWLSIAIASGFSRAIEKRDYIALNMTDDEIQEAHRLALEWQVERL